MCLAQWQCLRYKAGGDWTFDVSAVIYTRRTFDELQAKWRREDYWGGGLGGNCVIPNLARSFQNVLPSPRLERPYYVNRAVEIDNNGNQAATPWLGLERQYDVVNLDTGSGPGILLTSETKDLALRLGRLIHSPLANNAYIYYYRVEFRYML